MFNLQQSNGSTRWHRCRLDKKIGKALWNIPHKDSARYRISTVKSLPKNSISAVRDQQSVAPAGPTPLLSLLSRGIDPTDRSTSPPVPRLLLWSRTVSSAVGFLFVCLGGDSKVRFLIDDVTLSTFSLDHLDFVL